MQTRTQRITQLIDQYAQSCTANNLTGEEKLLDQIKTNYDQLDRQEKTEIVMHLTKKKAAIFSDFMGPTICKGSAGGAIGGTAFAIAAKATSANPYTAALFGCFFGSATAINYFRSDEEKQLFNQSKLVSRAYAAISVKLGLDTYGLNQALTNLHDYGPAGHQGDQPQLRHRRRHG